MFNKILTDYILFDKKFPIKKIFQNIRNKSFNNFKCKGLPLIKDEEWKYSNLDLILDLNLEFMLEIKDNVDDNKLKDCYSFQLNSYKLIFINNIFNKNLSQIHNDQFIISILSQAFKNKKYEKLIKSFYNSSPNRNESFFLLNTAFSHEGSFIHIKENIDKPIEIINFVFSTKNDTINYPRTFIFMENNSQASIIERHINIGEKIHLSNYVSEVFLGKNSKLDLYKIQNDNLKSYLIDNTSIIQKQESVAQVHTFCLGGALIRNNLNFYHKEKKCYSFLKGLTLIEGEQIVDNHTLVNHAFSNSTSYQLYRGVFNEKSKGIFNGKIIVNKDAQKTNAFQKNDNLILSNNVSINAKPQLEIFADDVKCSHGCTIGTLDEKLMFYLQSRGIPKKEAKSLLIFAFSIEILKSCNIDSIKKEINELITKKNNLKINLEL